MFEKPERILELFNELLDLVLFFEVLFECLIPLAQVLREVLDLGIDPLKHQSDASLRWLLSVAVVKLKPFIVLHLILKSVQRESAYTL